jgi:hypothetical protein
MVELEDKPDVAVAQLRQFGFRPLEKVLPLEKHFSLSGPIQSSQDVKESTLARSGSPFYGQHLSGLDSQIDPPQNFDDFAAGPKKEGFFQILGLDQGEVDCRA